MSNQWLEIFWDTQEPSNAGWAWRIYQVVDDDYWDEVDSGPLGPNFDIDSQESKSNYSQTDEELINLAKKEVGQFPKYEIKRW